MKGFATGSHATPRARARALALAAPVTSRGQLAQHLGWRTGGETACAWSGNDASRDWPQVAVSRGRRFIFRALLQPPAHVAQLIRPGWGRVRALSGRGGAG